ncbi:hypothetical protein BH20ACT16_BH20ACT16_11560 [soil metagenome]
MRRVPVPLLALLAALVGAAPASALTASELKTKIGREMRQAPTASGAYVRDMGSGEELYKLRENRVRIPASVEKLFTTSSALLRLGPTTTLQTNAVTASGVVVEPGGILRGDLVLVGGGDPFFGEGSGQSAALAKAVRAAGIRRVSGSGIGY